METLPSFDYSLVYSVFSGWPPLLFQMLVLILIAIIAIPRQKRSAAGLWLLYLALAETMAYLGAYILCICVGGAFMDSSGLPFFWRSNLLLPRLLFLLGGPAAAYFLFLGIRRMLPVRSIREWCALVMMLIVCSYALRIYRQHLNPSRVAFEAIAIDHIRQAITSIEQTDVNTQKYLRIEPSNANAHLIRANFLWDRGRHSEASTAYQLVKQHSTEQIDFVDDRINQLREILQP